MHRMFYTLCLWLTHRHTSGINQWFWVWHIHAHTHILSFNLQQLQGHFHDSRRHFAMVTRPLGCVILGCMLMRTGDLLTGVCFEQAVCAPEVLWILNDGDLGHTDDDRVGTHLWGGRGVATVGDMVKRGGRVIVVTDHWRWSWGSRETSSSQVEWLLTFLKQKMCKTRWNGTVQDIQSNSCIMGTGEFITMFSWLKTLRR